MSYNDLRKGRVSQIGSTYHLIFVTRERERYFASFESGRKLVRVMKTLQNEGRVETLCFVVMPDHLHWLLVLREGTLAEAVKLLKARSAHAIGQPIWQPNFYDHAVRQEEDMRKMARYIVANPLRANLVESIGDYSLWDAVWLDEKQSG
jgi:REP element-mobilizing transposase RayT